MMKFNEYFRNISNDSFNAFYETSHEAIKKICADRELLVEMLSNVLTDDALIDKSECYDFLDKIVFFSDECSGIFARISLFNSKYANRIHYHRWDYTACILEGSYKQLFYGLFDNNDITELHPYSPNFIEERKPQNIYTLKHCVVHSIMAAENTISVCIRGKALLDKFQTIDPITNSTWWQYGSKLEASEEKAMKSIDLLYLQERIAYIKSILNI